MAHVPQDLIDQIRTLAARVRQLEGRAQIRPALTQVLNGDVVIGEGGRIITRTPGGQRTFAVGQTAQGDWGVWLARDDGSSALTVGDDVLEDGQMIRIWSRSGQVIMMDDAWADGFLGRPWVPVPMAAPVNFTAETDTPLHSGQMLTQHKVLRVNLQLIAPAGTSAEVSMHIAGTQYGPAWALSTEAPFLDVDQRIPLPAGQFEHGDSVSIVMWGRRTAGAGTCSLRVRGIWGVNTANATEAE